MRGGCGVAVLVAGTAVAVLVGDDGAPLWRVVRVLAVVTLTVLAHRVVVRGTPGRGAATAFAAGCTGVAVGVGIAVPHLAKTGVTVASVAGLAALVAGLWLVGVGGVAAVRRVRGWHRLLLAPALIAVLVVAVFSLGQAVAATNVPATSVAASAPPGYREVRVLTADHVALAGWYVPSRNGAAVVARHGSGSTRTAVLRQAAVLARHGYGVLLLDARGHGRSGGRAMDFGWYGDADVSAGVSFLAAAPDVDPHRIGAVGLSMGGEEAIGAAAADPRLRAVVAEGATARTTADRAWLSQEFGWRGTVQRGLEWLTYSSAGGEEPDEAPADRWVRAGSPSTVSLWVAPGATHTQALAIHPREWEQRVTAFLDAALS